MSHRIPEIDKLINRVRGIVQRKFNPCVIAIDGRSGVGKSTISNQIAQRLNGAVIPFDDFYKGGTADEWDSRSIHNRYDLVIDWNRARTEVLVPLINGETAKWYPFDVVTCMRLSSTPRTLDPRNLLILEGQYSNRPELRDMIDLSVLVTISDDQVRKNRLVEREGIEFMNDWHERWDPVEEFYYSQISPQSSFDMKFINE